MSKGKRKIFQCMPLDQPLPIYTRPWEFLSMDFFVGLAGTKQGFGSIYVVVERLSKMAYFIPCKTIHDASQISHLFFKEVVRIHGLPMSIVSNRDTKFMSHFLENIVAKFGQQSFGSSYHP